MKLKAGLSLSGLVLYGTACALLWPHARDASIALAARDSPVAFPDIQLKATLRNNPSVIESNIEAALAAHDSDLTLSFVSPVEEKNILLTNELTQRVNKAVAEQHSPSHLSKRFATGLITGSADDVASLSGTVAGDLFVVGDIRDVVRESKQVMGEATDRLVLGLASAGLAVTAATWATANFASANLALELPLAVGATQG